MRIRPGANAVWLIGATVPMAFFTAMWPGVTWLLAIVALVAVGLAVADYFSLVTAFRDIRFTRTLPGSVGRGADCRVDMRILNPSRHRIEGTVRDVVPDSAVPAVWQHPFLLEPSGVIEERYACVMQERGLHEWGLTHLRLKGRFGVLEGQRALGRAQGVKVYPESAVPGGEYRIFTQLEYDLNKNAAVRRRGHGMEFDTIDRFAEGDDPRHIDWPSTARYGELMVRRYQQERHREVVVLLDCGRLMGARTASGTKLDQAVDAALLLFKVAIRRGDSGAFGVYDNRVRSFQLPQRGDRAYKRVLESVYGLECSFIESDFSAMFATLHQKQHKRSLVVIISDIVDSASSGRMKRALAELRKRHIVVFVAVRTPSLSHFAQKVVASPRDVMSQAVAMQLEQEREKALHHIRKLGVTVLDTEPDALTVPLLNHYVRIREQGQL